MSVSDPDTLKNDVCVRLGIVLVHLVELVTGACTSVSRNVLRYLATCEVISISRGLQVLEAHGDVIFGRFRG